MNKYCLLRCLKILLTNIKYLTVMQFKYLIPSI